MKSLGIVLRLGYLLVGASLLVAALMLLRDSPPLEGPAHILLYGMIAVSFPAGLAVVYFWAYAAILCQSALPNSAIGAILGAGTAAGLTALWLLLLLAGYLQWFVAIPAAIGWIRARSSAHSADPAGQADTSDSSRQA